VLIVVGFFERGIKPSMGFERAGAEAPAAGGSEGKVAMFPRLLCLLSVLVLGSCSSMQRELSDDEWCKSSEYRPGTREYAECRQRIDRQRARAAEAR
jgi:hypothetical protein